MTRSLSLPQTNLVAYFRLDEGAGNFAYDASGEGQMGTLVNGPVWVASTIPFVPGVVTLPASEIGTSSASLNGLVNPNGAPALAWFEWGATTNYGNLTSSADAGSGTNAVLSSKSFSGLSANEIFNYRIVASNSFGLITGENQASVSDIGLPRLSIALAGSNALVSWPAAATSYSLETSTNLPSPTIWTEVSTLPQTAAGENIVTLPIDAMNRFLRLRQAPTTPASAFNNVPAYNLGMESAVNPAGGAAGDATYSQGISQVANAGAGGAEAMSASQGVLVSSGEFVECAVDLAVPSRGFSWKMERKYRSGATFDGPLGHNWDFSYNRRLFLTNNGDAIRMDGYGRADRYAYTTKGYLAPTGYYTQLTRNQDGTFLERDRHGAKVIYSGTNSQGLARMTELRDRNGNRMQFQYNNLGQLCRVLDTLGRAYTYRYDAVTARLIAVDDFAGRTIKYAYDINGDLVTVTSPGVTGTPNGNDFPNGKTWHYAYSSGFSDERLNHNLVAITAPNEVAAGGQPYLHADYQEDTSSPDVDRIKYLRTLGANTSGVLAGGTISYQYQVLGTSATNDFNTAVFQNTVTDRNGNQCQYQFNRLGNMVRTREFTRGLRAQEPPFYETLLTYNGDGQVLSRVLPLGNRHVYTYDSTNPDRFQQGNLLSVTAYPDQVRGGDQTFLKTGM
ncbi:MAG: DUF6531 domain-containing protein, partial [Verrucomicrobia bacterium]|nr:DUF6531 domain-containing protein [Verrucomicrobiota bacterium]